MLIAYLVLLCEFFWEFSIFHFCRPLVDIYWHPLLQTLLEQYQPHFEREWKQSQITWRSEKWCAKSKNPLTRLIQWPLLKSLMVLCAFVSIQDTWTRPQKGNTFSYPPLKISRPHGKSRMVYQVRSKARLLADTTRWRESTFYHLLFAIPKVLLSSYPRWH